MTIPWKNSMCVASKSKPKSLSVPVKFVSRNDDIRMTPRGLLPASRRRSYQATNQTGWKIIQLNHRALLKCIIHHTTSTVQTLSPRNNIKPRAFNPQEMHFRERSLTASLEEAVPEGDFA